MKCPPKKNHKFITQGEPANSCKHTPGAIDTRRTGAADRRGFANMHISYRVLPL